MGRENRKTETVALSHIALMTDLTGYLKAVKLGINPSVPSVDRIREALSCLGKLPRMEIRNHCLLLRSAGFTVRKKPGNNRLSYKERQLIYRVLEAL